MFLKTMKENASIKMQVQFCFSLIVPQAPLDRWLSQCLQCQWAGQLLLQLNIPKSGLVHLWASQLEWVFSWNADFALQQTCPLLWCPNNSIVDPPDQRTLFYKSLGLCLLSLSKLSLDLFSSILDTSHQSDTSRILGYTSRIVPAHQQH